MTAESDIDNFGTMLQQIVASFRQREGLIRRQFGQLAPGATADDGSTENDMLERATRRFIIDELLRALDWDPGNPEQVSEEVRLRSAGNDRLYLDYLGISPADGHPVVLIEAKGFDVAAPKKARGPDLDAVQMAKLVAEAINAIRRDATSIPIHSDWSEFLDDLRTYLTSLNEVGRSTLKRAVITSGNWAVVFDEPIQTFLGPGRAHEDNILCFTSLDEIVANHRELYFKLHRERLVDTLPFALDLQDFFRSIRPDRVGNCYQAVLVTTTNRGAIRNQYPCRDVYPAVITRIGSRWLTIVNHQDPSQEPNDASGSSEFNEDLEQKSVRLRERIEERFGRPLAIGSIDSFPGFQPSTAPSIVTATISGIFADSIAALNQLGRSDTKLFVKKSNESAATREFVVATGSTSFYKATVQAGTHCNFHVWDHANGVGVAPTVRIISYVSNSFSKDGEVRHCAHGDHRSFRSARCHVMSIDEHLCCKTCIFEFDCWRSEPQSLPCPSTQSGGAEAA